MSAAMPLQTSPGDVIRVLLVEDEEDLGFVFVSRLQQETRWSFDVQIVGTLQAALEKLSTDTTDIVLLDLGLPDSQGHATFERVRSQAPSVPVVIMTALQDEKLALEVIREGALDYVLKQGIDTNILPRMIRYILERHRLETQLREMDRMKSVEMLAGGIAHDLNNLLLVIRGSADLLARGIGGDHPLREYIEELQKAGADAAAMTSKLLDFSRRQVTIVKVFNLNELIGRLEKMIGSFAGGGGKTIFGPWARRAKVKADPLQIERCLMNLVMNAVQAMPQGGDILVATSDWMIEDGDKAPFGNLPAGKYVMAFVRDTGTGITEEVRQHAFEPFFTTKTGSKGTGLGLASTYGIIKQAKGHIEIRSAKEQGTEVRFCLPLCEEGEVLLESLPGAIASAQGKETILLVEDHEQVRGFIARAMKNLGYTVLAVCDGAQALSVLGGAQGKKIQVLLTDMVMPGVGGRELMLRAREQYPHIKVVLMSGYDRESQLRDIVLDANTTFLAKPCSAEDLGKKVQELLQR